MTIHTHLLQRALELSRSGQYEDARRIFQAVLRSDPSNELAWRGYVDTFADRNERLAALMLFESQSPGNPVVLSLIQNMTVPYGPASKVPLETPVAPVFATRTAQQVQVTSAPNPQKSRNISTYFLGALVVTVFISLVAIILVLIQLYATLRRDHQILAEQYEQLIQVYKKLSTDHVRLQQNYTFLEGKQKVLQADYSTLLNSYDQLYTDYSSLQSDFGSLQTEYSSLQSEYIALEDSYNTLDRQAIKPPYIYIRQRNISMTFFKENGELWHWGIPFESLELAIEQGYATRENPSYLTFLTRDGEEVPAWDYTDFVQPGSFSEVMSQLYRDSPDDETFIRQVWKIVTQLTVYTSETGNIPRYPLETLLAGGGDCEDLSILFASMIMAAPVDWKVDLVYLNTDDLYDPPYSNHLIVAVSTGERRYMVETTSDQNMEPFPNDIVTWSVNVK